MAAIPENFEEKVLGIIASVKRIPRERVTPESTFEQLGIDSLDGMNILFEIEGAFDISIPDEQAKSIRTVREMLEGVRQLVASSSGTSPATAT